jgi:hypothetical protein
MSQGNSKVNCLYVVPNHMRLPILLVLLNKLADHLG